MEFVVYKMALGHIFSSTSLSLLVLIPLTAPQSSLSSSSQASEIGHLVANIPS
jgi:hypothetical protein